MCPDSPSDMSKASDESYEVHERDVWWRPQQKTDQREDDDEGAGEQSPLEPAPAREGAPPEDVVRRRYEIARRPRAEGHELDLRPATGR